MRWAQLDFDGLRLDGRFSAAKPCTRTIAPLVRPDWVLPWLSQQKFQMQCLLVAPCPLLVARSSLHVASPQKGTSSLHQEYFPTCRSLTLVSFLSAFSTSRLFSHSNHLISLRAFTGYRLLIQGYLLHLVPLLESSAFHLLCIGLGKADNQTAFRTFSLFNRFANYLAPLITTTCNSLFRTVGYYQRILSRTQHGKVYTGFPSCHIYRNPR